MKYFTKSLALVFLFMSSMSMAQTNNVELGFKGGLSIPNLTAASSNPLNNGYGSRVGADVGAFVEFHISKHFSLQPQIEYSSQGGIRNGYQAFPISNRASDIQQMQQLAMANASTVEEQQQLTQTFQQVYKQGYLYADYKSK